MGWQGAQRGSMAHAHLFGDVLEEMKVTPRGVGLAPQVAIVQKRRQVALPDKETDVVQQLQLFGLAHDAAGSQEQVGNAAAGLVGFNGAAIAVGGRVEGRQ